MATSIFDLERAWAPYPQARRRAAAGRASLQGFGFPLAAALLQLVQTDGAPAADPSPLEGLGDVTGREVRYLVQMKATPGRGGARAAALEALSVDEFLERTHPDVREHVRLVVRCGRPATDDPRRLRTRDLRLKSLAPERWAAVRERIEPVVVGGDPWTELLAALLGRVDDPAAVADQLLTRAARGLAEGVAPAQLWSELADVLSAAPRGGGPTGRILLPGDFVAAPNDGPLVLGRRPAPRDLAQVLARPPRAEAVAATVSQALAQTNPQTPVVWLHGPSGAGKSVLLLQALQALAADPAQVIHRVDSRPADVLRALRSWRREAGAQVVLAVDELYAAVSRDDPAWPQIAGLAGDAERLVILTSGTTEDAEAFRNLARRDESFAVIDHEVAELDDEELEHYAAWAEQRGAVGVAAVGQRDLAMVALDAEIRRARDASVAGFAQRLMRRSAALGIGNAMRAALAMNRLGVDVPVALFADQPGALAQLATDGVIPVGDDAEAVCVFHPRVAGELFDALHDVSPEQVATDMAAAARAAAPGSEPRLGLLVPLQRSESEQRLGGDVMRELLQRLQPIVWNGGAPVLEELTPWIFACRRWAPERLDAPELRAALIEWLFAEPDAARALRAAWRVLRPRAGEERTALEGRLIAWLRDHQADPGWTPLMLELLKTQPPEGIVELAGARLAARLDDPLWVELLLRVQPLRPVEPQLLERALGQVPPTARDEQLWAAAIASGIPARGVTGLVCRRICQAPAESVVAAGVRWIAEHATPEDGKALRWALSQERDAPRTASVLRMLMDSRDLAGGLVAASRQVSADWLARHPESPEWVATWVSAGSGRGLSDRVRKSLHAAAGPWLQEHQDHPDWITVVRRLVDEDAKLTIPGLEDWLRANPTDPAWAPIWRKRRSELPSHGLAVVGDWLRLNTRRGEWREVFDAAWAQARGNAQLRTAATAWLADRPQAKSWPAIFWLIAEGGLDDDARRGARRWLVTSEAIANPRWAQVFTTAVAPADIDKALVAAARRWIDRYPNHDSVFEVDVLLGQAAR